MPDWERKIQSLYGFIRLYPKQNDTARTGLARQMQPADFNIRNLADVRDPVNWQTNGHVTLILPRGPIAWRSWGSHSFCYFTEGSVKLHTHQLLSNSWSIRPPAGTGKFSADAFSYPSTTCSLWLRYTLRERSQHNVPVHCIPWTAWHIMLWPLPSARLAYAAAAASL